MRVRWTAEARSDLIRLYEFLALVNPRAAARVVQLLRIAPTRLREHPRLGPRLGELALIVWWHFSVTIFSSS